MWIKLLLALGVLALPTPAQARRSDHPGQYKIRCVSSECSDRYHYRAPRGEAYHPPGYGRSRRSRY